MKKRNVFFVICATLLLATGCYGKERGTPSIELSQMVNSQKLEDTSDVPSSENDTMTKDESVITGEISDIKDFMFVITDKDGVEYALSFEGEKPEGLSAVKDGDTVSVIYTGKLEQAEAFTGTIVSVTKE